MSSIVLSRDPDWLGQLETISSLTLLSEDGCQVPVSFELLVAVSPLVSSMMADLLPPAYSPHVISIPAVIGDVLLLVAEILSKGSAAVVNEGSMEKVQDVFKMMRIEAFISCCQFDNNSVADRKDSEDYDEQKQNKYESDYYESEVEEKEIKVKVNENIGICENCFKCGIRVNNMGTKSFRKHMLSHYSHVFDNVITAKEPFNCPICNKAHKKRGTLVRHYAITHNKIFEMTDLTPQALHYSKSRVKKMEQTEVVVETLTEDMELEMFRKGDLSEEN